MKNFFNTSQMRLRSGRVPRDNTSQMRLRSGRGLRDNTSQMCLRSGLVLPRQTTELSACERRARERRRVVKVERVVRPEVAVQEQTVNAGEPEPESVDPETIIQPAHSPVFIFRAAAYRMQARARLARPGQPFGVAALVAATDPPARHDDLLAEPAWDWEGFVRSMNDELGLPN